MKTTVSKTTMLLAGVAILLIGLGKAWATAMATGAPMIIGCGGETFVLPFESAGPGLTVSLLGHCWGCYAALFGGGLVAFAGVKNRVSRAKA